MIVATVSAIYVEVSDSMNSADTITNVDVDTNIEVHFSEAMDNTSITVKLVLVLLFNFLEASANDITITINDFEHRIDKIKN